MAKVFVEKEGNSRLRMVNTTDAAIEKGDFAVLGSISGVALEKVAPGATGAFHVEEGLLFQISASNVGGGLTNMETANGLVYFDMANGTFHGAAAGGEIVGQVIEPLRGGVVRAAKFFRTYPQQGGA